MRDADTRPARPLPTALGPFGISGVLGEGGSAIVYAAEWQGQSVALKVPRDDDLTERDRERFLSEARMLARVQHRSVVEVLDAGRLPDGQPYLLMRRYEGETLAARIARDGALPAPSALDLFDQLAQATIALHDAGLVHRDLKPENVFLVDDGNTAKLLDFGIAKDRNAPASTTTQAGIARGTPATMAPERFFGAAATVQSDVYELSVVLYVMLVGSLPWSDVTNVDARLNPVSPRDAGADIPEPLSTVILRALSTRPERRPQGVRELSDEVKRAARGEHTTGSRVTAAVATSTPPPPLTPEPSISDGAQVIDSQRGRSRRSLLGPALALVALAGGVAVGVALVRGVQSDDAPAPSAASAEVTPAAQPTVEEVAPAPAPTSTPTPETEPAAVAASPPSARKHVVHGSRRKPPAVVASAAPSATPPAASPPKGKPKGAPCTRSSECASMLCAAETCQ